MIPEGVGEASWGGVGEECQPVAGGVRPPPKKDLSPHPPSAKSQNMNRSLKFEGEDRLPLQVVCTSVNGEGSGEDGVFFFVIIRKFENRTLFCGKALGQDIYRAKQAPNAKVYNNCSEALCASVFSHSVSLEYKEKPSKDRSIAAG